jgi:hypothetical protein
MLVATVAIAVIVVLVVVIALRPSDFRIVRSRLLSASPAVVHAHVNDFHQWAEWSPWEKLDPMLKREFSGPTAGSGAVYHWVGNSKAGEGRMTITDSRPPHGVTIRLEFIKPWTATHVTQFDFEPSGAGTQVTWTMTGRNNFMTKAMGLFMSMDKMIGPDFEKGLANLDAVTAKAGATASPKAPSA